MLNIMLGQTYLDLSEAIAPREDLIVSPWIVIAFFALAIVLILISINLAIQNKVNKDKLIGEQEESKKLSLKQKSLEKTLNDTSNEKIQLQNKNDELVEINDKLKKMAYFDSLTNLPNRLALKELLDSVMLTLREGETVGLLLLNIDDFKQINSQLSNSYGDELLIDVTHRLKQVISEDDYLARIGGDEFVILTQNISDPADYDDKLKRILNLFSYPFVLSTEERFISVSIGVVLAPRDGNNTTTLLKNANVAMRSAKGQGKNRYVYFEESMNEAITKKIQIQSELRKGFEDNEFEVFYEPVISLEDNKIVGLEALLCWNHPTDGILHPSQYMFYAEVTGLIGPIGVWALKDICKQLKVAQDLGHKDIKVSYNVSKLEFKDPEFVSIIWDIVTKSEIDPSSLVLEITEDTAMDDVKHTEVTITKLGELGIKFTIDKFGSKYSSIRYLNTLPITNIKLDKILTKSAIDSIDEQKVILAIINLIKTFKLNVIAEGVESKQEEMFLKYANCDMAQGPLFSNMISKDELIKLLEQGYINNYDNIEEEV